MGSEFRFVKGSSMGLLCAAIQFAPEFKKPRENLARIVSLVQKAAQAGAELVVLPELATSGYSFMSGEEAEPFSEVIEPPTAPFQPDKSLHVMRLLAKQWKLSIVWGLIEKDPLNGKLYNSQVYIDPTGYIESYRKINLWGNDFIWATAGEGNPPIIRTKIGSRTWKIGLLICRDIRDKRDGSERSFYESGDADLVCFSANWGDGGFPATTWMEFVKGNVTTLIVANRYGKEIPNNFGEGGACIITPTGRVLCKGLIWNKDCIVIADVP
jgi:predicted amidohydrolase